MAKVSQKRQRVAIIVNTIAPYRLPIYDALAKEYDVRVFSGRIGGVHSDWSIDLSNRQWIARQYTSRPAFRHSPDVASLPSVSTIWQDLTSWSPHTVVLGGWSEPAFWSSMIWARVFRRNCVLWLGSTTHSERSRNPIIRKFKRFFLSQCDAAFCYSRAAADLATEYGMPSDRLIVGTNVGDVEGMARAVNVLRNPDTSGGSSVKLLFVGQLVERKGIRVLLEQLAQLSARDWILNVVGDGELRGTLETIAARTLAGRVLFHGYVTGESLVRQFASSDVFVLPSLVEPASIAVSEALASGLVAVGSKYDPSAEELIIPGENGFVVDPLNANDLAAGLQHAISLVQATDDRDVLKRNISAKMIQRGIPRYARGLIEAIGLADQRRLNEYSQRPKQHSGEALDERLFLTCSLANKGGGAFRRYIELIRSLLDQGGRVVHVSPAGFNALSHERLRVVSASRCERPVSFITLTMAVLKVLKEHKPASVIPVAVCFGLLEGMSVVVARALAGRKLDLIVNLRGDTVKAATWLLRHCSGDLIRALWVEFRIRMSEAVALQQVQTLLFVTEADRKAFMARHRWVPPRARLRIAVIPNNANPSWLYGENNARLDPERPRILYVGALYYRGKGIRYLLEAFQKLCIALPQAHLTIVGDGPDRETIDRHARTFGDRVELVGPVDNPSQYYCQTNVVVVPTESHEGSCNVALEGLGTGAVVIGSRIGGIEEILGYNDLLFEPADADSLWRRLMSVLHPEGYELAKSLCTKRRAMYTFAWGLRWSEQAGVLSGSGSSRPPQKPAQG